MLRFLLLMLVTLASLSVSAAAFSAQCYFPIPGDGFYYKWNDFNPHDRFEDLLSSGNLSSFPLMTVYVPSQTAYWDFGLTAQTCGNGNAVVLSSEEYLSMLSASQNTVSPFDSTQASQLWWGGFSIVIFLYIFSLTVGQGLRLMGWRK